MDTVNLNQTVYEMVHNVLSSTDIKAICKSRGFSDKEANSRSLFENTFLTPIGLNAAFKALSPLEVIVLHLLSFENRIVDVSFFERVYREAKDIRVHHYGTFTQRFKPIFDKVQSQLVRKGLLVINESKTNSATKVKMELWRYYFPPAFVQYLPPLLKANFTSEVEGNARLDSLRIELFEAIQKVMFGTVLAAGTLKLTNGTLTLGSKMFTAATAAKWQQDNWETEISRATAKKSGTLITQFESTHNVFQGYLLPTDEYRSANPLGLVIHGLAHLSPNEWIEPEQLTPVLKVYYGSVTPPPAAVLCEVGYQTGNLVEIVAAGKTYYKLPQANQALTNLLPSDFLEIAPDGAVTVLVESVPYNQLEILNVTTELEVKNNKLIALPNINKLLDAPENMRQQPILLYLQEHSKVFQELFAHLEATWGKLILHENLLIARVGDLGLLQRLQQTLRQNDSASSLVILPNNYIAFPRALLPEIEKQIKKAGFVVKTVKAE